MNDQDQIQRDELTARLMADTVERPSPALNARVMALLMKERRRVYVYTLRFWLTPKGLLSCLALYMLFAGGALMALYQYSQSEALADGYSLSQLFPIVLTIGAFFSCFLFFVSLDKWFRWRMRHAVAPECCSRQKREVS